MRLNRPPSVIVNGAALARFADPHAPTSYARGVLWVGIDPTDPCKVTWTEGVRLSPGTDAVDTANMHAPMRDLYERTMHAGSLPTIE